MPHRWHIFLFSTAVLLAGGQAPAPTSAPAALTGTLQTGLTVTRIAAVDRGSADVLKTSAVRPADPFLYDGTFDAATHTFHIPKVLASRTYDLVVWTTDAQGRAARWEGATMDYHAAVSPAAAATAEDWAAIEALVTEPAQFYDKVRPLRIAADHGHATVLVELMRTREFHSDQGGELIYRVELWYFENRFGGWAKDANTEKVLARVRGTPAAFPPAWQFLPALGGLRVGAPAALTLPEGPDARRGWVGGAMRQ
jgi:hypothetical protein